MGSLALRTEKYGHVLGLLICLPFPVLIVALDERGIALGREAPCQAPNSGFTKTFPLYSSKSLRTAVLRDIFWRFPWSWSWSCPWFCPWSWSCSWSCLGLVLGLVLGLALAISLALVPPLAIALALALAPHPLPLPV